MGSPDQIVINKSYGSNSFYDFFNGCAKGMVGKSWGQEKKSRQKKRIIFYYIFILYLVLLRNTHKHKYIMHLAKARVRIVVFQIW